jgi:hypothetical protein
MLERNDKRTNKRGGKGVERIEGKRYRYTKDIGKEERAFPRQAKEMKALKRTSIMYKCCHLCVCI